MGQSIHILEQVQITAVCLDCCTLGQKCHSIHLDWGLCLDYYTGTEALSNTSICIAHSYKC